MLILRDMRESDVENHVRWFTTETEWGSWDAPWEPLGVDEEEVCQMENYREKMAECMMQLI